MAIVEKSVLVEHSAARMYALVDRVDEYPRFLPWCGGASVLWQDDERMRARIDIDYHHIRHSFTTENLRRAGESIEIRLVEGPFRVLDGVWRFKPLGEHACRIDFRLRYEFSSRLLERLLSPVFGHIANSFVEAFTRRAADVYGRS